MPDDELAKNIQAMGAPLGELYTALSAEVTWLCLQWAEFCELFASSPKRLDILNSAAPFFFWLTQRSLWFETLLGISRLAGPPKSVGKDNLSVQQLPLHISDLALRARIEAHIATLKTDTEFAKDWRNRHIAHRDLDLALNRPVPPLSPASQASVDTALKGLATILNQVQGHYYPGSSTLYQHRFSSPHGGGQLLYVLRDGLRREELRQRKLEETGEYNPIDWNDDLPAV